MPPLICGVNGAASAVSSDLATTREAVEERLPKLARDGYRITSPRDDNYNCVAWVVRDVRHWWGPGVDGFFWPRNVGDDFADDGDLHEYVAAFSAAGFETCSDGVLEIGFEKIAVYSDGEYFEHVAYQCADGEWSSKLGALNDIRHASAESLCGPGLHEYSPIQLFMRRVRQEHPLAETGLILPGS